MDLRGGHADGLDIEHVVQRRHDVQLRLRFRLPAMRVAATPCDQISRCNSCGNVREEGSAPIAIGLYEIMDQSGRDMPVLDL